MEKFKKGDFLYLKGEKSGFEFVFILQYLIGDWVHCYCSICLQNPKYNNDLNNFKHSLLGFLSKGSIIRLATEDEISHLVTQMCKHNLTWDKELLELVDNGEI